MYTILLKEEDMINKMHFPVIAHINEAYGYNIIEFIKCLIQGVGTGYNYTCSTYWSELDDYDKTQIEQYDGLLIETDSGDEVIISDVELLYYLKLTLQRITDPIIATEFKEYLTTFKTTHLE